MDLASWAFFKGFRVGFRVSDLGVLCLEVHG